MSVINTMLRDLEQREGQTLSGRYQPPAPRRWSLLIGAALSLLIVVPTLAYWLWPGEGPSAEPVAAGPVVHSVPLAEKNCASDGGSGAECGRGFVGGCRDLCRRSPFCCRFCHRGFIRSGADGVPGAIG